jgi:hypothetical protein
VGAGSGGVTPLLGPLVRAGKLVSDHLTRQQMAALTTAVNRASVIGLAVGGAHLLLVRCRTPVHGLCAGTSGGTAGSSIGRTAVRGRAGGTRPACSATETTAVPTGARAAAANHEEETILHRDLRDTTVLLGGEPYTG